jgi:hypothetical protein
MSMNSTQARAITPGPWATRRRTYRFFLVALATRNFV